MVRIILLVFIFLISSCSTENLKKQINKEVDEENIKKTYISKECSPYLKFIRETWGESFKLNKCYAVRERKHWR